MTIAEGNESSSKDESSTSSTDSFNMASAQQQSQLQQVATLAKHEKSVVCVDLTDTHVVTGGKGKEFFFNLFCFC